MTGIDMVNIIATTENLLTIYFRLPLRPPFHPTLTLSHLPENSLCITLHPAQSGNLQLSRNKYIDSSQRTDRDSDNNNDPFLHTENENVRELAF